MRRSKVVLTLVSAAALTVAGIAEAASPAKVATLADRPLREFQPVATDHGIRLGSIGSGLFRSRSDKPHEFWMVTDRGPNGQPDGKRTFPVPDFNPAIVKVRVKGKKVEILKRIPLKTKKGAPVTGLPNFSFVDSPVSDTEPAPDEVPYNFDGSKPLETYNQNGLDTEDVVRTSKGDFWIVDEYRPSVVKVSGDGVVLARYVPKGLKDEFTDVGYPVHDTLPASHAYRRQNRGYEGLALSPDQKHLFVALQSPLQLPPDTTVGRDSRNTRILRLNLDGHVTGEFVYRFDWAADFDPGSGARARDMKISGLYAISDRRVLVLERTDFVAKVYLVDVSKATDLGDWKPPTGAALNYVETLNSQGELQTSGIDPLPKDLIIDLDTVDGMPDKIEAVAVVNRGTLAVANDNDFGLTEDPTWDGKGRLSNDTGAKSRILYVTLPQALPR
ncbi:MAG: esterase-like activity of phytase family protein [Actinomycetota bacterium]|jgi:hypothetical protein